MLVSSLKSRFRNQQGVSLIVVMSLTMMLLALAAGATKLVVSFMKTTSQVEQANVAYLAAEGGVEMALYDLAAYKDGYQTDYNQDVCGAGINFTTTSNFTGVCSAANDYRFANFSGKDFSNFHALSLGRGFWRLFSRTLPSQAGGDYIMPNPYFVGNKDGILTSDERGTLTKSQSFGVSLLTDGGDLTASEIHNRFTWVQNGVAQNILFDPGANWHPSNGESDAEALMTWTLSAIDSAGEEHTLQGVVNEGDFTDACGDGRNTCFLLDLNNDSPSPDAFDSNPLVGEDINRNLLSSETSYENDYNRVSGVKEIFQWSTPAGFIDDLNNSLDNSGILDWGDAWLSVSLIGTLSETSGVASNSLSYKFTSDQQWADEYTYIVSEGFSGGIKQTIETRFRRGSAIPIFSYVIFQ
ncbi:MAG: hypothetical protein PHO48_04195 [Candidatus Gracilibacteria bacterium]|jgi:hypothetical protein|nr:hypothetical protein [Candidatus Gracilibacteria bacterium]